LCNRIFSISGYLPGNVALTDFSQSVIVPGAKLKAFYIQGYTSSQSIIKSIEIISVQISG
jgi:hypothetical protein